MRECIGLFFRHCIKKKKDFYWQWDDFIISVQYKHKMYKCTMEIPIRSPPYMKHHEISISACDIIPILMALYDLYPSSPFNARNNEDSVRFLSFRSFLHLSVLGKIRSSIDNRSIRFILAHLDNQISQ